MEYRYEVFATTDCGNSRYPAPGLTLLKTNDINEAWSSFYASGKGRCFIWDNDTNEKFFEATGWIAA